MKPGSIVMVSRGGSATLGKGRARKVRGVLVESHETEHSVRLLEDDPDSTVAGWSKAGDVGRWSTCAIEAVQFRTTMIDPPWLERGSGQIKRGADKHYPLLTTPKIIDTIRECPIFNPAPDSHLYLWTTNTFLVDALRVVDALGFRYVTNVVWTKRHIGIGRYFRGQHEILLFAVRGRGMAEDLITESKNIPSVINADHVRRDGKRVHSAKPPESYALIESRSRGPYAEIFARSHRAGWESWGNEV